MMSVDTLLTVERLKLSVGGKHLLQNLSMSIPAGGSLGILGKNGTGKTTLLHTLLGLHKADAGAVTICGRPLQDWTRKELAVRTGIVFQSSSDEMPATVLEMAVMGRYPHGSGWRWEKEEDLAQAREALRSMDLAHLENRQIATLSGGERQRLAWATLLTQAPRLYVLDEPGNHLDIGFQIQALSFLQQKLQDDAAAVCMATHDINLASRFCQQIVLFDGRGDFQYGSTAEILTEENLGAAFDCEIRQVLHEGRRVFYPL